MSRKTSAGLLWLLSSLLLCAGPQALFNGKNLDGWTFDVIDPEVKPEAVWSVSDGLLICKGKPPAVMRTTKDFKNYTLTVEWRWAPGKKPGNSGVLVHASKPREMFVWPKSIEVQLGSGNAGDFWTIGEKLTVAGSEPLGRRWLKRQESTEHKPGDWNTMVIRCDANKVSVRVNDVLMNYGKTESPMKGAICLQSEGGEIHFRKVELTPIK